MRQCASPPRVKARSSSNGNPRPPAARHDLCSHLVAVASWPPAIASSALDQSSCSASAEPLRMRAGMAVTRRSWYGSPAGRPVPAEVVAHDGGHL